MPRRSSRSRPASLISLSEPTGSASLTAIVRYPRSGSGTARTLTVEPAAHSGRGTAAHFDRGVEAVLGDDALDDGPHVLGLRPVAGVREDGLAVAADRRAELRADRVLDRLRL